MGVKKIVKLNFLLFSDFHEVSCTNSTQYFSRKIGNASIFTPNQQYFCITGLRTKKRSLARFNNF